jgi:NAD(P)-dependent dehydrogenase (short-subunit alcohol dehydrogenase family)
MARPALGVGWLISVGNSRAKDMYKGFDLSGKVAALTGSTAGMGFAIARGLAQCGAKIVVSSNAQEDTDQAVHALLNEGFDVAGVRCDITDRRDIGQFGVEAKRAFGKVDILFCNAVGPVPVGPVQDVDLDALDKLLISTVSNNLVLARQFLPEMAERRYGSIVMMSSIASQRPSGILGGYGAAKAALNGIVRSIAVEWGASNVRANAIAPSFVRTAFSKDFWSDPQREKALIARTPAGRIAEVEEVVGAAILLASPAGAYISGQVLLIDGARSVT